MEALLLLLGRSAERAGPTSPSGSAASPVRTRWGGLQVGVGVCGDGVGTKPNRGEADAQIQARTLRLSRAPPLSHPTTYHLDPSGWQSHDEVAVESQCLPVRGGEWAPMAVLEFLEHCCAQPADAPELFVATQPLLPRVLLAWAEVKVPDDSAASMSSLT